MLHQISIFVTIVIMTCFIVDNGALRCTGFLQKKYTALLRSVVNRRVEPYARFKFAFCSQKRPNACSTYKPRTKTSHFSIITYDAKFFFCP
jgi:hypothetical protein